MSAFYLHIFLPRGALFHVFEIIEVFVVIGKAEPFPFFSGVLVLVYPLTKQGQNRTYSEKFFVGIIAINIYFTPVIFS